METLISVIVIIALYKLIRGGIRKLTSSRTKHHLAQETIFEYPEGGYGFSDDPVVDEMIFLDLVLEDD